ncbi:MAG: hypothetical protein K2K09_06475, partial [Lachnospiraceae bacterium]|nr:hypothetical protein [Lachnospiraceae bacterium]
IILCLCGCRHEMETERQVQDKMQIAQGIIENIEANKLLLQDSIIIAQFDSVSHPIDYAVRYSSYATRSLRNSNVSTFYPQPVSTQIDVTTDKIFYSNDSLKCAAFIVVDIHFDILPEFEDPKSKHKYEGFAIYGVRNSIDSPFKIYPINSLTVSSRYSDVSVKRFLETAFNTKEIRDCGTAGTYMEKRDHKYWFGHEKFFEDSPDFKTDSSGVFWCEYNYHPVIKPVRKYFYSNRDR